MIIRSRLWIFISLLSGVLWFIFSFPCIGGGLGNGEFWTSQKPFRIPLSVLRQSISEKKPWELTSPRFEITCNGKLLTATTTLDQDLQAYLQSIVKGSTGQMTAIVCLDPVSGRILAMAGFDRGKPEEKVWTQRLIPSASIFKIITAAGAIEFLGMSPMTLFHYNGGKHTLYRYQLEEKRNRYTCTVTLKDAFKDSINPVFGKLGSIYLGRKGILEMADRFMWQRQIPLEIPVKPSTITLLDDKFNLAEVASGFNKATRITPIHGALIVAAIANRGVIMAPSFIDTIESGGHDIIYQSRIYPLTRPVNPRTADLLFEMMKATVEKGTAKKAFSHLNRDKVLKDLEIGGKTGTIDNESHELRYDWFCGIARQKDRGKRLALSVVVAHRAILGTRAASFARLAIRKYFSQMEP